MWLGSRRMLCPKLPPVQGVPSVPLSRPYTVGHWDTPKILRLYLTQTQFDTLRTWAQQTPQVQEAYLFGSYAKGNADSDSDVEVAIKASAVDWTFRTAKWEQYLTKAIGVKVHIRTLLLERVREACGESSVRLKG